MTELSDELLVAYVDGQLARKQTRAVEKVLEQDDVIARRVEALKDAHSRLEAAFDAILAGEELEVAKPEPERPGFFVPWATAVKVGLAGTWDSQPLSLLDDRRLWLAARHARARALILGLTDPDYTGSIAPSWQETAARAQGLLSRESLEVGLESQGNLDLVAFQLGQAIGPGLKLPNLDRDGYRFVRAQLLRSGEEPLAQLLYLGTSGAPLALYAKKSAEQRSSRPSSAMAGSAVWRGRRMASPIFSPATPTSRLSCSSPRRSGRNLRPPSESRERSQAARTPPYSPLPNPLDGERRASRKRAYCASRAVGRIVAGEIAVEVAPDRRRALLVAIAGIVLDRGEHGVARIVVSVLDLRHLLGRDAGARFGGEEVRAKLVGIEDEAAMARARRGPADLDRPRQGILRRDVARFFVGGRAFADARSANLLDRAAAHQPCERKQGGAGDGARQRRVLWHPSHGGRDLSDGHAPAKEDGEAAERGRKKGKAELWGPASLCDVEPHARSGRSVRQPRDLSVSGHALGFTVTRKAAA